jgi:hypothetical protein
MTGTPHMPGARHGAPAGAHRIHLGAGSVLCCAVCDRIGLVAAAIPDCHVVHLTGVWGVDVPSVVKHVGEHEAHEQAA